MNPTGNNVRESGLLCPVVNLLLPANDKFEKKVLFSRGDLNEQNGDLLMADGELNGIVFFNGIGV